MKRIIITGLSALLLFACATPSKPPTQNAQQAAIVWPAPPIQPRVKYLYQFNNATDLGISQSWLSRLWNWFSGRSLSYDMVRPYAIAVQDGLFVVTDPGRKAVHLFNTVSNDYELISNGHDSYFSSPVGAAIGNNKIYISDSSLGKIFVFNLDGDFLHTIEDLKRPTGLYYDHKNNRLYASDTLEHKITAFTPGGDKLFSFGQRKENKGSFNFPSHLALHNDKLYVNDTMNFRVQAFDLDGKYISGFGKHGDASGYFSQPKGIDLDSKGHIYVADAMFHRVQIFNPEGQYLMAFGKQGRDAGDFWLPSGLFINQDKIYVADSYNRRVQVFQYVGE